MNAIDKAESSTLITASTVQPPGRLCGTAARVECVPPFKAVLVMTKLDDDVLFGNVIEIIAFT